MKRLAEERRKAEEKEQLRQKMQCLAVERKTKEAEDKVVPCAGLWKHSRTRTRARWFGKRGRQVVTVSDS